MPDFELNPFLLGLNPESFDNSRLTKVENIVPGIKPPLPTVPPERSYRAVIPADTAMEIREGLIESERLREFFKPFAGQILVEIGPGELITGYRIALLAGAKAYIAVEPFHFINNLARMLTNPEHRTSPSSVQIPRTAIKADALSFLKRLPDRSVSIFASQLESTMEKEYETKVAKEIERVLHPEGALIQYDSNFVLDTNIFTLEEIRKNDPDLILTYDLEKYQSKP